MQPRPFRRDRVLPCVRLPHRNIFSLCTAQKLLTPLSASRIPMSRPLANASMGRTDAVRHVGAAVHGTRNTEMATAEAMRNTVDQFATAGNQAFKDGFEKSLGAMNEVNAQGKRNLEAVAASVTAAAKGAEA